ncbi:peptidylprolyl isomerase [Cupriavidus taiwanensis]|uniref:peptidylprolyl isomerase n=1 Tax=Cupriavidus taiwanensis TaxID=164546 RepID=UPI000E10EA6A|nr:peptidylprolyl isomerase [Cupriavidus taiwanensis]SOY43481.1 putative Peptidylprolyl isomerase; putative exported protein [Cupriavidus taiwanensis]SOY59247.1 putative Peptidylprolyl isomerase; putative exported protein [Cupriavidus taiwanensis]SOY80207.1 putative Peptidylprolyl isomerase; putative exported protein [Cupriavidus taiwanensis]SOZ21106.1 putative Peptidylprolyl isomerase; putative exported protein [Cupriavidus taiwanensis]SOZ51373.1 putative Peptidylprolyl isomerase; putative ex
MKTTVLSFSLAAVLAAGSLPAIAQNAAVVNGKAIPSAKLDKLIAGTGQPDSPELRTRARNMLIDRELLVQEANKRGLTQRDDVQEQLEQARLNVLAGAVFEDYVKSHGASDAELRKQYDKIKSQFGNGKEYHARHILVEKEADAKAIIAKIKGGAKFEEIAKTSSKDPGSGANGGDLDWANSSSYVPEFSAAMTGLKKGQMTDTPVKTQFGWHIIELLDVRDAKIPSFEEVKPQLTQMLMGDQNWQREQFQAMMKSLKDKAKIQ